MLTIPVCQAAVCGSCWGLAGGATWDASSMLLDGELRNFTIGFANGNEKGHVVFLQVDCCRRANLLLHSFDVSAERRAAGACALAGLH